MYNATKVMILLVLLVQLISCGSKEPQRKPTVSSNNQTLKITPYTYDLGSIENGASSTLHFVFHIHNMDTSEINLDTIEVSCSCLSIEAYPSSLQPGQRDSILGVINVTRLPMGHIGKTIIINYNEDSIALARVVGNIVE